MQSFQWRQCCCGLLCETEVQYPHWCKCGCHPHTKDQEKKQDKQFGSFLNDGDEKSFVNLLLQWTGKNKARILYDSDLDFGQEVSDVLTFPSIACIMITRKGGIYGVYCPQGIADGFAPSKDAFLFCFHQEEEIRHQILTPSRWMARDHAPDFVKAAVILENLSPQWDNKKMTTLGKKIVYQPVLRVSILPQDQEDQEDQEWITDNDIPWPNLVIRGPGTYGYYKQHEKHRKTCVGRDVYDINALFEEVQQDILITGHNADPIRMICIKLDFN